MSTIAPPGAARKRPSTPYYGIETQEDGMLAWDWVVEQMTTSRNYWVCTTRPDGRPHASPVWGVWIEGVLYFSMHRKSVKARNMTTNADALVHLESGDDTVIFEGELVEIPVTAVPGFADVYEAKYDFRPELEEDPDSICVKLVPSVVLAWLEANYPKSATRWEFD